MDNDLDPILSSEQDVLPSTQFVGNVMVAIRREASTPAPLSFPWWRVMPGAVISISALSTLLVVSIHRFSAASAGNGPESIVLANAFAIANRFEPGWVALALVVSYVPTKLALARLQHGLHS